MHLLLAPLLLLSSVIASPTPNGASRLEARAPVLPAGAFDLAGYAKVHPDGETTGGKGGATTTVSAEAALKTAVKGTNSLNIVIKGNIALNSRLSVGSNKSIIGLNSTITKNGININSASNVIIRNLNISKITGNDGITIQNSKRVWIDHNEFSSEANIKSTGPDKYDGQVDIVRASDYITVSWNYFHDHWKSSLVGNSDALRSTDFGYLHVTYHHNYWRNEGTRGNAGRFGHQHLYNNYYLDFHYQAIHSRSDNQVLVEGNVFRGDTREALSTYGLVIPEDSPNTSPAGDYELDGFANLGSANDWGPAKTNITRVGTFTSVPYKYSLTALASVQDLVVAYAGVGKI